MHDDYSNVCMDMGRFSNFAGCRWGEKDKGERTCSSKQSFLPIQAQMDSCDVLYLMGKQDVLFSQKRELCLPNIFLILFCYKGRRGVNVVRILHQISTVSLFSDWWRSPLYTILATELLFLSKWVFDLAFFCYFNHFSPS